jgi:hypothetical protein
MSWAIIDGEEATGSPAPSPSSISTTPSSSRTAASATVERNRGRTLDDLLDEFARLRAANLHLVRSWHLTEAELDLQGKHPTFGPVTLRQLLSTWVAHDLGHGAQVARVMAKHYGTDVGPWRDFLPVLADRSAPRAS